MFTALLTPKKTVIRRVFLVKIHKSEHNKHTGLCHKLSTGFSRDQIRFTCHLKMTTLIYKISVFKGTNIHTFESTKNPYVILVSTARRMLID